MAIRTSPMKRSSEKTGSRSCSIAAWPETKTSAPGISPTASRMSSVWPFASAGSRLETINAVTTASETGWTAATSEVGSSTEALAAASCTSPTSCSAEPGSPRATMVNEPVVFWPNSSSRILSALAVSVPGSVKRFVSRAESPAVATVEARNTTTQTARTAHR